MGTATFERNAVVEIDGQKYRMVRKVSDTRWQLEHSKTARISELEQEQLLTMYADRKLRFANGVEEKVYRKAHIEISETAKLRRLYVIAALETNTIADLKQAISHVWRTTNRPDQPPSHVSVYRWKKRFLESGSDIRALEDAQHSGNNAKRKTLSEFLRRHGRAINDLFTQTIELGRRAGLVRLGHVAIDSTRVQANASRQRMVDAEAAARQQRAGDRRRVRQFQQRVLATDPDEGAGVSLAAGEAAGLEQQLATAGEGLAKLPRGKRRPVSATDPDSRFLRTREGWVLGYTGEVAVSDDHFIVAARVTQSRSDNASLLPMLEEVEQRSRCRPEKATADSGFFSGEAVRECARRGIDVYVPDNNLRHEMSSSGRKALGVA